MNDLASRFKRVGRAAYRYFGPVANSVQGQISKPECKRVLVKVVLTGGCTWGAMQASLKDEQDLTDLWVPLATATVHGALEVASVAQQGEKKPKPDDDEPHPTN